MQFLKGSRKIREDLLRTETLPVRLGGIIMLQFIREMLFSWAVLFDLELARKIWKDGI